ncbi:MAG: T9SS type A sorting domain-containing protein [Bacteroidales bacterium]|nr:T9SS type A sorting domain-containing protein [Bacteroidales bacterium]
MNKHLLRHIAGLLAVVCVVFVSIFFAPSITAQVFSYPDALSSEGFALKTSSEKSVSIDYSIHNFELVDVSVKGEVMKSVTISGSFLFNEEGAPDLPGYSRYIAVPQGATAKLNVINIQSEVIQGIEIAPAPRIPKDNEDEPLFYHKDRKIYNKNSYYPENPVALSAPMKLRGVDVVMLGITPFQYNPVTKELVVYRDMKVEIEFEGGNGHFGEDRLRSRFWDPLLEDAILNHTSLPPIDYASRITEPTDLVGCEYLIICPNGTEFQSWADSIRQFRIAEGITTMVKTLTDVGGNTTTAIENYINTAYNTWTPAPAAILLLGDYGTNANNSIIAPIYNSYCASDNIYADVDNDHLPEICLARITANNNTQLQVMCSKFLNYERNPPTSSLFYNKPITALGWQTVRWFQICSETVGGFWKYEQGKDPTRINEVYIGNPGSDPWSTATNTSTVMNYFGPNGENYIPATPQAMPCCWTGGNATAINNALNAGAFCLMHRDHGAETGWGEPSYNSNNINGLTNTNLLSFIFSINCLTGKYNWSNECFAEKFHRYTYNGANAGALGLIAASEVSYSFVNDTYVWGMMDNFWTDFMPTYGTTPASRDFRPCFGNAAGKIFLEQSNWPYNTGNKQVTYHLFHHHGDAFSVVYSEVPQALTVIHNSSIPEGSTSFTVTANSGSFICLSVDDEILGIADGTGSPVSITIPGSLIVGDELIVTVTMQNYFRYKSEVSVIYPSGPIPDFEADTTTICAAGGINFTDLSTNNPTSWSWTFQGGTPGTSTVQNPQNIVYNSPGSYNVSLTVGNGTNFNSTTKPGYIDVSSAAGTPNTPSGDTLLCENSPNTLYTIYPVSNASSYTWTLVPDTAGFMNQNDTSLIVDWSSTYIGYASISVQAVNGCGPGSSSPLLQVHLRPFPETPEVPTGPTSMCEGIASSIYTVTPALNAESYIWKLEPTNSGAISGTGTTSTVDWDPYFFGTAQVKVRSANACNESPWSDPLDISIIAYPVVELGNDTTILITGTLLLDAGNSGSTYLWNTGAITQTVTAAFQGNLSDTYWAEVNNSGCISSDTIVVSFADPVGSPESFGNLQLLIAPNPNRGLFRIEITSKEEIRLHLELVNTLGATVFQNNDISVSGSYSSWINVQDTPNGMYSLKIHIGDQVITKKIIIQR